MPFQIATPTFSAGETIPKKFTCDGPDVSPQLSWKEAPAGAQSFALIMDDPDAPVGTWVHWVLYNAPANITELPEGVEKQGQLAQRRACKDATIFTRPDMAAHVLPRANHEKLLNVLTRSMRQNHWPVTFGIGRLLF